MDFLERTFGVRAAHIGRTLVDDADWYEATALCRFFGYSSTAEALGGLDSDMRARLPINIISNDVNRWAEMEAVNDEGMMALAARAPDKRARKVFKTLSDVLTASGMPIERVLEEFFGATVQRIDPAASGSEGQ